MQPDGNPPSAQIDGSAYRNSDVISVQNVSKLTYMPPLPAVPNVLSAKLHWSVSSDVNVTTGLFFSYAGPAPSSADCLSLATTFASAMSGWGEYWDEDTTLLGCTVTDLSSSSGGVGSHDVNVPGGLASPLSGASCVLVNYQLPRRYRGGKPRSYLPWGAAGDVGNRQTWLAGRVSLWSTAIAEFFTTCIGASSGGTSIQAHVNVSYYEGFTLVTSPTTGRGRNVPKLRTVPLVTPISSFVISPRIANQRRRG